ncbi:LutC/YkgG family protein [Cohnella hashimotonis]|uniref:LUD domain-containing protein n=1 Tax=Cohnella hashimotonis TaxID=2826895 RepID=A0ABT6TGY7_9BACL|nr:LUD domain-containing protein [Cohnella hashimotonis]MDI4646097.1 LUD domain-containing protein [Cohnella hashimotonis]
MADIKRQAGLAGGEAEHAAWLAEMERASRAKQETFMNGIAARLRHPRTTSKPVQPVRGAPDFWRAFDWTPEERVERFEANWRSVGGHTTRAKDLAEAGRFIAERAQELSARIIVRQDQAELAKLDLEASVPEAEVSVWNADDDVAWKARAAEADIGVVIADQALAYTGTVVVRSAANKGRSVSLLPTVLFILIPVERLGTRLGEALIPMDEGGREALPAGVHFITGPSRSSDIENDLTIGVHGPGVVYAVIVG